MFDGLEECQEWRVFKEFCSEDLMHIIESSVSSKENRKKIVEMLYVLGFEELSIHILSRFCLVFGDGIGGVERITLKFKKEEGCGTNELIQMFLDNIESSGLRELFEKRQTV